jgi:hypothetical protein
MRCQKPPHFLFEQQGSLPCPLHVRVRDNLLLLVACLLSRDRRYGAPEQAAREEGRQDWDGGPGHLRFLFRQLAFATCLGDKQDANN